MPDVVYLGYMAAFCTTCSFVPQVLHILKTKDTRSISLGMYSIFVTGVFFWLVYGIIIKDAPIMVANVITLALSSTILIMKIRDIFRERKDQTATQSTTL
ncbi:SemiSWEET transporter [Parendozoicomonas haliclonae]|uniref:PQ loop repeat protein n=1 Tax=Parendozoicomonas haliclonae TaxID=1960125 RepID=A0A1X7ANC2_9GAMM|nr:SemiSWEET transporter [Parendozoicomonas haliclonae]SMA48314.1 PQ loop repeat protein [Parendozoicomonas haliclonae]